MNRTLVNLLDRLTKLNLSDDVIHHMCNGLVCVTPEGEFTYENGMLRSAEGVHALSPARISAVKLPSGEQPEASSKGAEQPEAEEPEAEEDWLP